jgi:ketosteroid isomerase-like protein
MADAEARIEAVRSGMVAFSAGDESSVLRFFADDIEIHSEPAAGNAGDFRGHDGYAVWLGEWLEAWNDFDLTPVRMEAVGEHHVVAETHQTARGRGSGVPVEQQMFYVFDLREDGRVAAMHLYVSWERAMAVAREREEGPSPRS